MLFSQSYEKNPLLDSSLTFSSVELTGWGKEKAKVNVFQVSPLRPRGAQQVEPSVAYIKI